MRTRAIIGIDPGAKGAVCAMHADGHELFAFDDDDPLSVLGAVLADYAVEQAYLERVSPMPGNGTASMFKFGETFGKIQGWLRARFIPYELVSPRVWQKLLHVGTSGDDPKARSLQAARQLFPSAELVRPKCRKPHDGLVDALLIAEYGRRKSLGSKI